MIVVIFCVPRNAAAATGHQKDKFACSYRLCCYIRAINVIFRRCFRQCHPSMQPFPAYSFTPLLDLFRHVVTTDLIVHDRNTQFDAHQSMHFRHRYTTGRSKLTVYIPTALLLRMNDVEAIKLAHRYYVYQILCQLLHGNTNVASAFCLLDRFRNRLPRIKLCHIVRRNLLVSRALCARRSRVWSGPRDHETKINSYLSLKNETHFILET